MSFLLTYNQEQFIGQTIQSILAQEAHFRYQLVIGEDCSTDNTRKICEQYAEEYAEKIKLLPSEKNYGLIQNFIRTYKECDGKYVAICDGDDYWIDPYKLQKQVNFLEENPDFSVVFTGFNFLFPNNEMIKKDYSGIKKVSAFEDLIKENYISSVTALFRNKKTATDFPNWLGELPYGDWPLYLWTTKDGSKIKLLKDVTAVYRREIGVSEKMKSEPSKIAAVNLKIIENTLKDDSFQNNVTSIERSFINHKFMLLASYINENRIGKSIQLGTGLLLEHPLKVIRIMSFIFRKKFMRMTLNKHKMR